MSTKAVIIWLVLAVVLGMLAIIVLRLPGQIATPSVAPIGSRLLTFVPSEVRSITVVRADGSRELIEQSPQALSALGTDAQWQLRLQSPNAPTPGAAPWPITGPSMQSLLRILAELSAIGEPAKDITVGDRPFTITIALSDGSERTLRLAERTLAGTCLAEVISGAISTGASPAPTPTTVRTLIDAKVHDLFTNPGPRAWRETALLAALAPEASRIRLENAQQKLALAKTNGRWALREPVATPADPGSIQALIAELGRVHVADFLDGGSGSAPTGLESPVARLAVEVDRRTQATGATDPSVTTMGVELAVGRAAESSRGSAFASVNGERVILVDAAALARITMDPTAYIWPHPTRLAAADIGTIVLDRTDTPNGAGSKAFKRGLARWSQIRADGTEITLADKALRDADALAAFLTGGDRSAFSGNTNTPPSRDDRPTITLQAPEDLRIIGRIKVLSLAGDPMETIEVSVARPGSAVLRTGSVFREYVVGKLPTLLAELVNAAPPSSPSETDKKPEMNK